jgi:hypothetical protein
MTSISTSFMRSSLRDMTDMTDMRDSLLMSLLKSLAGGEILSSTCTRLSCCIRRTSSAAQVKVLVLESPGVCGEGALTRDVNLIVNLNLL